MFNINFPGNFVLKIAAGVSVMYQLSAIAIVYKIQYCSNINDVIITLNDPLRITQNREFTHSEILCCLTITTAPQIH